MRFSLCLRKNPLNLKTCVNASNSVGQDTCVEITCKTAGNCQQLPTSNQYGSRTGFFHQNWMLLANHGGGACGGLIPWPNNRTKLDT